MIDDCDYERLRRHKWSFDKNGYAVRKVIVSGRARKILLHREILSAPAGMDVDHIDGNRLNNMRSNLRICTRAQNCMNRKPLLGSASHYKGVTWHKHDARWQAMIRIDGKQTYIGRFSDETEAARAYDDLAYAHYGEFAYLNFPERYR